MPWIVYETRNRVNGRVYVGVHKQHSLGFDGYWGSGTVLLKAIKKYGAKHFIRRTLHVCDTPEEAYSRERQIVTDEWCKDPRTYNQKTGGRGGFGYKHSKQARRLMSKLRIGQPLAEAAKRKISESLTGRRHSTDRRQKISKAMSVANLGRVLSDKTRKLIAKRMKETWRLRKMNNGP